MKNKKIKIIGARVNNLKNINLDIPKNQLTVVTGLSGSGKSSLAFDTVFAEGQRRYIESLTNYAKQFLGTVPKPEVEHIEGLSPAISIDQKSTIKSPRSTVATMSDVYDYLRLLYTRAGEIYCPKCQTKLQRQVYETQNKIKKEKEIKYRCLKCNIVVPDFTISSFSFNSPEGACVDCRGLGKKMVIEPSLVVPNQRLTLAEGAIRPWARSTSQVKTYAKLLENISKIYKFNLNTPFAKLSARVKDLIFHGTPELKKDDKRYFEGVVKNLDDKYKNTNSNYIKNEIKKYMVEKVCPTCNGARLKPTSLAVKFCEKNIYELTNLTIDELAKLLTKELKNPKINELAKPILKEVITRLGFIQDVGLHYLTLARNSVTLSGGEAQRIRLATQLGSYLTGVVYILDEPSIGLHSVDQDRLIKILKQLRDLENTVIVVEHDKQTMINADHIIDMGPGAGEFGGKVVAQGNYKKLIQSKKSLTAKYLRGEKQIEIPKKRRKGDKHIVIKGASEHNLKDIDVSIPLNTFTGITGISGSGKTSLIFDILAKALKKKFYKAKAEPGKHRSIHGTQFIDKVIVVDQSPIGKTPRSNPVTYTGILSLIRDVYANLEQSKTRRYNAGHFSFNVVGGRCETCKGDGVLKFEMYFLPDAYVTCPVCGGSRYNKEILDIKYQPSGYPQSKNISEVLQMTVTEALIFFKDHKLIYHKLKVLDEVGLGYIRLGQSAMTLSGGEAQRIKLATELARKDTSKTLYILDEPTTGLHFEDIKKLLKVVHALVDKGNSVIVIEHNMDVIKNCDYLIDMGPVGGKQGGKIVAKGTPEHVAKSSISTTAKYLKNEI